jgi:hypothetical protein
MFLTTGLKRQAQAGNIDSRQVGGINHIMIVLPLNMQSLLRGRDS